MIDENYSVYIREAEKSETLLLNEISNDLESQGKKVYRLGFGQSPFPPHEKIIESLSKNANRREYINVQGHPELLKAAANFHNELCGFDFKPENVLVGPGSKVLIFCALNTFTKADVLIPRPAWVSYEPMAKHAGHNVIRIPTTYETRWHITPEQLEDCARLRPDPNIPLVLILNYPGNPVGQTYTEPELKALKETLEEYNVIVISDEIYGLIHHENKHKSLYEIYPEKTIVTTGLSKWCGAGGWRLGLAFIPDGLGKKFKESMIAVASETFSCTTLPVQYAAIEAYTNIKLAKEELTHQRRIYSVLGNWCQETLAKSKIYVHPPQGGFYLYIDFSEYKDKLLHKGIKGSQVLCAKLLEDTGVAVLPADAFGAAPSVLRGRLAYVDFDGRKALEASKKIPTTKPLDEDFIKEHCPKVHKGINLICEWVSKL